MDISAQTPVNYPLKSTHSLMEKRPVQNSSPAMGEALVLDPSLDDYQQADQAFQQLGYDVAVSPFRENAISGDIDKVNAQVRAMMMASKQSADFYNRITGMVEDGRSHIEGLHTLIGKIHSGYQKQYAEVVKAATTYMQDVNTALGTMSQHMKAGDNGKIKFYPEDFAASVDEVMSKYTNQKYSGSNPSSYFGNWDPPLSGTPLIKIPLSEGAYKFWKKKLDGQGFVVNTTASEIVIYPDFKPIKEVYSSIANSSAKWGGSDISAQEFQSMQTAIDAQKNTMNSSVSRLLETFRQDNSHFETLVQLLIQLLKDLYQNSMSLINI